MVEPLEDRRMLAVVTVDNNLDVVNGITTSITDLINNDGGDGISLREAILAANTDTVADTINFSLDPSERTITLTETGHEGELDISQSLTIEAEEGRSVTIDANARATNPGNGYRIFNIANASTDILVTLDGLTLTRGYRRETAPEDRGGAIFSTERLIIRNSTIEENESFSGGGIYLEVPGGGTTEREVLRIENSIIDDNFRGGGGVRIISGTAGSPVNDTFVILNTTFSNNEATDGGGLYAELHGGSLTIENSSFDQNIASEFVDGDGGGLYAELHGGSLTIENSSFDQNTASNNGGGIALHLSDATAALMSGLSVTENEANGAMFTSINGSSERGGGGIYIEYPEDHEDNPGEDTTAKIIDSVISGNKALGTIAVYQSHPLPTLYYDRGQGGGVFVQMAIDRDNVHGQSFNSKFTLTSSKVTDNEASDSGGGVHLRVYAGGEAVIQESTISGNEAGRTPTGNNEDGFAHVELPYSGGGVYAYLFSGDEDTTDPPLPNDTDDGISKLTIAGSTIDNNLAGRHGGGVAICAKRQDYNWDVRSAVEIYNTTISTNIAGFADNPLTPTGPADPIGTGGGVHIAIFNRTSGEGRFDDEAIDVHFTHTTVTKNQALLGGGIYSLVPTEVHEPGQPPTMREVNTILQNALVSGNNEHDVAPGTPGDPDNFYGSINDGETQYNIFGDATDLDANDFYDHITHQQILFNALGTGNINNTTNDPELEDLAHNGGLTQTHKPRATSQAIDAGLNNLAHVPLSAATLTTDQRGRDRKIDYPGVNNGSSRLVDIGAYELQLPNRIEDVVLAYSDPATLPARYTFYEPVAAGEQLRTVFHEDLDVLEIHFTSPMDFSSDGSELTVYGKTMPDSGGTPVTFILDSDDFTFTSSQNGQVGRWEFDSPLPADKYRIELTGLKEDDGSGTGPALDGEWENLTRGTFDDYTDDPTGRTLLSGDGIAGGDFTFFFAVLPGDYDGSGVVDADDLLNPQDGDGNGIVELGRGPGAPLSTVGDQGVHAAHLGEAITAHLTRGDLVDDEITDGTDWAAFVADLGTDNSGLPDPPDLLADFNGDNKVDHADFLIFQDAWNDNAYFESAWRNGINFIVVSSDSGIEDTDQSFGELSLREALTEAGQSSGADTIIFSTHLSGETIDLNSSLLINSDVTIVGLGVNNLAISGQGSTAIFNVSSGVKATITDLTIRDGDTNGSGGGIYTQGDLKLFDMNLENNSAFHGGAIFQRNGSLSIERSTVTGNESDGYGGALAAVTPNTGVPLDLDIDSSTFYDNEAGGYGGGLYAVDVDLDITNSTFSDNLANDGYGGAIAIKNNDSGSSAEIINSTIAFNRRGGIENMGTRLPVLHNTIVAKNTFNFNGPTRNRDVTGNFSTASSYNLIGTVEESTGLTEPNSITGTSGNLVDPLLDALADNGGPTLTHALLSGSDALDAADDAIAQLYGLDEDQRGEDRDDGNGVDIGAFEWGA